MKQLTRWGPLAIAVLTLLAIHLWYLMFMLKGAAPLGGPASFQTALLASLRDLPGTVFMLLPVWLPSVVPTKWPRLHRWATLACGAVSLAVTVSFAIVVALHREHELLAVVIVYGAAGVLHLIHRPSAARVLPVPAHGT